MNGLGGGDYAGRYQATWKREFKRPWREAGPPNHLDHTVDSDQLVVNKGLSLSAMWFRMVPGALQAEAVKRETS